jgi:hypothetical protein
MTDYVNGLFEKERACWDFRLLRPILVFSYFFLRCIIFPLKFVFHRIPFGFEGFLIDWVLSFGMKYFARQEAVELLVRHVQIEPLLYRHLLRFHPSNPDFPGDRKLNGIDGDFNVESIKEIYRNNMTIAHDLLSYEIADRFDKQTFLEKLDELRSCEPEDIEIYSRAALEENKKHSFQLLGATNVAIMIVFTITLFADLKTAVNALNSFFSDSIVLWCMKHLYANDSSALIDLDFFAQEGTNRGHYNSSAFFSDPSRYLYYHIVFDEVVYDLLRNHPPQMTPDAGAA